MRSLLLSFCCLFAIGIFTEVQAQQAPPAASQVVKDACSKAAKNNKKVFVIFHASWCGWCHRMDTAMNDASCKKYFTDNYEIRHITVLENGDKKSFENPGGFDMLAKYNGDKEGIPFWLILSPGGELLADSRMKDAATGKLQNVGCPAQKAEVDYFITLLEKTSRMKSTELDAIRARFSKIAPSH